MAEIISKNKNTLNLGMETEGALNEILDNYKK